MPARGCGIKSLLEIRGFRHISGRNPPVPNED